MKSATDHGFFVGYFNQVPPGPRRTSIACMAVLLALFASFALLLGRDGDAAATGQGFSGTEIRLAGVVRLKPYPLLLLPPDASHARGRAVMLAGDSKRAPSGLAEGSNVDITGLLLKRGSMDMLVVGAATGAPAGGAVPVATPAGRWQVSGEICDGKCAAGAMHPGTGLAHKACANLCISGGLPPVLAMQVPVLGASFLLLADMDGGPVPAAAFDLTALPVSLEGEIERLGDILLLKADWSKARRL